MTITPDKIGTDDDLAREVLVIGISIAPCIKNFEDESEDQKNALAILKRVYGDIAARGPRFVKAQRIGPASVDYGSVGSAFEGDPETALRSLCTAASQAGMPLGSFPTGRPIGRIWPEVYPS